MKEAIHFAHANGFPGACYRKFYANLAPFYQVTYVAAVGHNPDYPVTDNWDYLVQELILDIEKHHRQPIIGVGHSLGGVLHFMASNVRPDLYKATVLLDSPLFSPSKFAMIRVAKWLGTIDRITPAARTKNRQNKWPNAKAVMDYLKERPLFAHFDPDCLADYVEYGMDHTKQGVQLKFAREIEYTIYRTIPHTIGTSAHRRAVPTGLLYGKTTNVIQPRDIAYMQNVLHIETQATEGGHLFPFEHPAQAANDLGIVIQRLLSK